MMPRFGAFTRPTSPSAQLGVPVGNPVVEQSSARRSRPAPGVIELPQSAPFLPESGAPTDGSALDLGASLGNSNGPGTLSNDDVELGGGLSDSIDEGTGAAGSSAPEQGAPADAGVEGAEPQS